MDELSFFDENIPCLAGCPVHTNAGAYVAAIADGDDLGAYLIARLPNPFASACGRVCAAPCEDVCRRGVIDRPIAIRALKRFATERYGVEAHMEVWRQVAPPPAVELPHSVGIVGGGPAGLACAHDLRLHGYQVTVYEATDRLGGMMVLGIPEYRLDRDLLDAEIAAVVDLGVEVRLGTRLGRDVTLAELRSRHEAVFLALGATVGRGLDLEGHEADGVLKAIEFLLNVNQGFRVELGSRVVVVGGGDVAMDAARTALRAAAYESRRPPAPGREEERARMTEAMDAARSALRAGAAEVTVMSLESREEMPAQEFEIEEAEREGIRFLNRRGPSRVLTEDGRVTGLETVGVTAVFDERGRFDPRFDPDDRQTMPADTVILAVGQAVDLTALGDHGPQTTPRGTIGVDPATLATSLTGVWAGGDAAHGPRTLIEAIADGRRVASAIHRTFGGVDDRPADGTMTAMPGFHRLDDRYDRVDRLPMPTLPSERRVGLEEVELGYTEAQARAEAARCLRCFANVMLDVSRCVLCALCVDVCPVDVLSLTPAGEVATDGQPGTALLLDERACIRCALCIDRCPTDALWMGLWTGAGVPEALEVAG